MTTTAVPPSVRIREARLADIEGIRALCERCSGIPADYTTDMLLGHLARFPDGKFVAESGGTIVGYSASFRIDERASMARHSWQEISGGGFTSRHDPEGAWLYGLEVVVDPAHRGSRVIERLHQRRQRLCTELGLAGIVTAVRLDGHARRARAYPDPADYLTAVSAGQIPDRALQSLLRKGFEPLGVLVDYPPLRSGPGGHAAHLIWRNPDARESATGRSASGDGRIVDSVRVATVQYQQRPIAGFDAFAQQVRYFVGVAADYRSDFVVFPELFTLQLLSIEGRALSAEDSISRLSAWTDPVRELLQRLAVEFRINIVGGSHPTHTSGGDIRNVCFVALRDGSLHAREKLHPTPNERHWWNIQGGDQAGAIMTDCGPIGVMICYDSEFPEHARHLVDQGALILFVPFCTDERQGYLRVRYCAQARAVENQCYLVLSGNVGNLPGVSNFDIQYAQSCILTPCDFPFARDGIAADTTPNVECIVFADLRLDALHAARASGTVQNLKDRRHDLYSVQWRAAPPRS